MSDVQMLTAAAACNALGLLWISLRVGRLERARRVRLLGRRGAAE